MHQTLDRIPNQMQDQYYDLGLGTAGLSTLDCARRAVLSLVYAVRLVRAFLHLTCGQAPTLSDSSHTEWSSFSSLARRASSSAINNSQASGLSASARFALRGRCNTTSGVPFCSKSGTQFLLPVDFHGVGRIARNPAFFSRQFEGHGQFLLKCSSVIWGTNFFQVLGWELGTVR
jgi:hypothetical protein